MSGLINKQEVMIALEKVASFFPYRVSGDRDSYNPYNGAWNDAIGRAEMEIEKLPSAEPEQTHNIMDFVGYQVAWLESHNDIELEPELEKWMVRMLNDTAECYIKEHPELEIIHCKDCKFYNPMNRETKTGICNLTMHQNFGDNWFCAGAERRTDD